MTRLHPVVRLIAVTALSVSGVTRCGGGTPPAAQPPVVQSTDTSVTTTAGGSTSVTQSQDPSATTSTGTTTGSATTTGPATATTTTVTATSATTAIATMTDPSGHGGDHGLMPTVDVTLAMAPRPGSGELLTKNGHGTHEQSGTGAVRIKCWPSHMSNDDPIVYPGKRGAAHHHTFFGNTGTGYATTLGADTVAGQATDSGNLAGTGTGNSTCPGGIANRTGYWIPSMIDTATHAPIVPMWTLVYYKGGYKVPDRLITAPPVGLRMIGGDSKATSAQPDPAPYHRINEYNCYDSRNKHAGYGRSIPACPEGGEIISTVSLPQCWDGVHLDSPDHKSHMAYSGTYRNTPTPGCPASHPVAIPQITVNTHYRVTTADGTKNWRLSSDNYAADGYNGGFSTHADWANGWDPKIMARVIKNCVAAKKDCGGPDLQDGTILLDLPKQLR
jgi:hypothetical protein